MNTFTATFASGKATIVEETTHTSPDEFIRYRFGGRTQFDDLGGITVTMMTPHAPVIVEAPVATKRIKKALNGE